MSNAADAIEPSVRASVQEWTPVLARQAEILADAGNLRLAAEFAEKMMGDDQVQGALENLVGAVLGLDISFEPGAQKRGSKKAIKALEAGDDWIKCFPEPELKQLVAWGVILGLGLGQIIWTIDPETGRTPGKLKVWNPKFLRWDSPNRRWMLLTDSGSEIEITPGDGTWILFTPKGSRRPWSMGAWRAIWRWWLLKDFAIRDWGLYSERKGQGTFVASTQTTNTTIGGQSNPIVSGGTGETRKDLAAQLQNIGRQTVISLPAGWKLDLVESKANTWQSFEAQIQLADHGVVIAILGTSLTNEEGGSYAKAVVLEGVHVQILKGLATSLATCLHDGHLVFWAELNFGTKLLAPWPVWDTGIPADLKAEGDGFLALGQGIAALKLVSPRVDVETMLADRNVPMLEAGDPAAVPLTTTPALPAPDSANDNEGDANAVDEPTDDTVDNVVPLKKAAPAKKSAAVHTPIDALAHVHDALVHAGGVHPTPPGAIAGQLYADAVADKGRAVGTDALSDDVAAVHALIQGATDYASLRKSLLAHFKDMDPSALATVMQRAIMLSHLGGRLAMKEDSK